MGRLVTRTSIVAAPPSGVVGMNMTWADLPVATTIFRASDFSSSGTSDAPFETTGDIGDNVYHTTGGLSNGPYWETRLKDPRPSTVDPEATNSFKCWADSMPADVSLLYVCTAVVQFSEALLDAMNPVNGGGKIFYQNVWQTNGTSVDVDNELVVIVNNGDQDQDNDTSGSYMNLVNGGAGGNYQNDGVHTNLNLRSRPDEKLWIAIVHDFRPASGDDRGAHIFYKYEGDPGITKALYRGYDVEHAFVGTYRDADNGRGFCGGNASGFKGNFFGYWDNIFWAADSAKHFNMYKIHSGNGRVDNPPF
jgi:hypothetical protein